MLVGQRLAKMDDMRIIVFKDSENIVRCVKKGEQAVFCRCSFSKTYGLFYRRDLPVFLIEYNTPQVIDSEFDHIFRFPGVLYLIDLYSDFCHFLSCLSPVEGIITLSQMTTPPFHPFSARPKSRRRNGVQPVLRHNCRIRPNCGPISKIPLHGFLWGLRQHLGGASTGMPIAAEVAYIIISPNFLTFSLSWGTAGPLCVSSSQCRISITPT